MKAQKQHKGKTGIYCIFNKINGKVYIGKSVNIFKRITSHLVNFRANNNKKENNHLLSSWNKYKEENFNYLVLEYCKREDLMIREEYFIKLFNSLDRNYGYNKVLIGGDNSFCSKELREKISIRMKKYYKDNPEILKIKVANMQSVTKKYYVVQFDYFNLKEINTFNSYLDINKLYPNFYIQSIIDCCSGTKPSYKKFRWQYRNIKSGEIKWMKECLWYKKLKIKLNL